ncbi:(Fe-S)-binding protein [Tengunoibacter tsumagoiensis]|uniref:Glycolate oxidase iron-sulfur subunit n=1 Tax=Tengunoibacter tsumagoiensis TaxID=2014871 RepID=A0A402A1V3_9CHLR|nr:heterodisulfide reductase-related iron-sulfur binding cluster [Tengunoibacter tsumagoiensis]GCE13035.1 glycolate oxidase iron-sulfur subunit [Tengunoibacter tsumagoiensis]
MSTESISSRTDALHIQPPIQGPLRRHTHTYDLLRQCIHCGFCLPTCPTYAVLGVEMDSPRGRIYQMKAVADGKLAVDTNFIEHMNCCVGCRACETACPSGVQFGKLIEAAREQIQLEVPQEAAPPSALEQSSTALTPSLNRNPLPLTLLRRFFFEIMLPSRLMLTLIFGGLKIYQRSGLQMLVHRTGLLRFADSLPTPFKGKLSTPEALMANVQGEIIPRPLPERTPALGVQRYRVGMISGCIMDQVFHDINEATIRVLSTNGCEVITPQQQGCCGALHIHAGEADKGRELARHNIALFEQYDCDAIIINSAGCGSTLKEYDHLLRDDPDYAERAKIFSAKVKDISEFLMSIPLQKQPGELKQTVAYHDACHLLHGQKIKQPPRQLLQTIPGLQLVELKESDWCCGSAGIYNLTNQKMAQQLLERKMDHVIASGASVIAASNPGCMMQIAMGVRQRGVSIEVVHPVQLLDEAYQASGIYSYKASKRLTGKSFFIGLLIGLCVGLGLKALTHLSQRQEDI